MNLRSPRIVTRVTQTTELTPRDWDDIWVLTSEFYDVEREYAESGAAAPPDASRCFAWTTCCWAWPRSTPIRRSSAVERSRSSPPRTCCIREHWRGRNLVQKLGARTFLAARLRYPFRPIYWFFDSLSYKSYLLLPRNFRTFWPRYDAPTPEPQAALIDQLATQTYGPAWRPARGVVVRSGRRSACAQPPHP